MKPKKNLLPLFLGCLAIVVGCKKKDDPQPLFTCARESEALDSLAIMNLLLQNNMRWSYRSCYQTGIIQEAEYPLTARFVWNGVYGVYQLQGSIAKDPIDYKGSFELKKGTDGFWYLQTLPRNSFIEGPIKHCGNHVLFNNQPAMGCDNMYDLL